jgi:hypothetical protein
MFASGKYFVGQKTFFSSRPQLGRGHRRRGWFQLCCFFRGAGFVRGARRGAVRKTSAEGSRFSGGRIKRPEKTPFLLGSVVGPPHIFRGSRFSVSVLREIPEMKWVGWEIGLLVGLFCLDSVFAVARRVFGYLFLGVVFCLGFPALSPHRNFHAYVRQQRRRGFRRRILRWGAERKT